MLCWLWLYWTKFCLSLFFLPPGGGEAVRPGRPDVWRVPGGSLRGEVRPLLLCQRHLPAVLLRVLLGQHPLESRPRVSQATGERGRRPPSTRLLPLELKGAHEPALSRWTHTWALNKKNLLPYSSGTALQPTPTAPPAPPCSPQTPHGKKKKQNGYHQIRLTSYHMALNSLSSFPLGWNTLGEWNANVYQRRICTLAQNLTKNTQVGLSDTWLLSPPCIVDWVVWYDLLDPPLKKRWDHTDTF